MSRRIGTSGPRCSTHFALRASATTRSSVTATRCSAISNRTTSRPPARTCRVRRSTTAGRTRWRSCSKSASPTRGRRRWKRSSVSTERMQIGVVGAGIIGLAVARRIAELRPEATVTVLDKERDVALHQSGRNSGVVHAGIYYAPGSLKARLCRKGAELLRAYCVERGLPLRECGKLVVALDGSEVAALRELERRATANGVPGLRWLDGEELRDIEPNAAGVAALHSPTTAITDFRAIARSFADDVRTANGRIALSAEVTPFRI